MQVRWLGWAGIEVQSDGARLLVDPLADAGAVFAGLAPGAKDVELPAIVASDSDHHAIAALLTHLHRDHADAVALAQALHEDATIYEPPGLGGAGQENLGLAQADAELARTGLRRQTLAPWESAQAGPFTVTALPAVDGLGDPQVSWLIESGERRVLHLGDTAYHGYWWRIAQRHGPFDVVFAPINGAVVRFPHRRPASSLPVVLTPEQAAQAGELLGARVVVPMHYDGYRYEPFYVPEPSAIETFLTAAGGRPFEARRLAPGESLVLGAQTHAPDLA